MNIEQLLSDVKKIEDAIDSGDVREMRAVYGYFLGVYSKVYEEMSGYLKPLVDSSESSRRMQLAIQGRRDYSPRKELEENYLPNLEMMKSKLKSLIPNQVESVSGIVIYNNPTNSNKIEIEINISFEDVKNQVKNMEDYLDDESINEILVKIDELESIINSLDKKSDKWKKARNIGKWIFDKSVDVGIALLPLFLKIQ